MSERAYVVNSDNFTEAVAKLVATFKTQNPGVGEVRIECLCGSILTLRIKDKPARKKAAKT
jgi:hypothetical protein